MAKYIGAVEQMDASPQIAAGFYRGHDIIVLIVKLTGSVELTNLTSGRKFFGLK